MKTWPEPFYRVWAGEKHHEVRKDDRGYAVGDLLLLREFDLAAKPTLFDINASLMNGEAPGPGRYLGRAVLAFVTYITHGGRFGLASDACVMSIEVVDRAEVYKKGVFNDSIVAYGGVL